MSKIILLILVVFIFFLLIRISLKSTFPAPKRLYFIFNAFILIIICYIAINNIIENYHYFSFLYKNNFETISINYEAYLFIFSFGIMILTILLFIDLIIKYRNRSLYKKPFFNNFYPFVLKPNFYSPNIILAEELTNILIQKNIQKYLITDFTLTTFLSYGDYWNKKKTYQKLHSIMQEIFQYLKLPPLVKLEIKYIKNNFKNEQIGQYKNHFNNRTITLKITKDLNPNNLIAILCHECTHYFMEVNNLNIKDTVLNEQRTDVLCNLLGFSKIMLVGYKKIFKFKEDDYVRTTTTIKLGYISADECKKVRRYLIYKRRNL